MLPHPQPACLPACLSLWCLPCRAVSTRQPARGTVLGPRSRRSEKVDDRCAAFVGPNAGKHCKYCKQCKQVKHLQAG